MYIQINPISRNKLFILAKALLTIYCSCLHFKPGMNYASRSFVCYSSVDRFTLFLSREAAEGAMLAM